MALFLLSLHIEFIVDEESKHIGLKKSFVSSAKQINYQEKKAQDRLTV
jgi:hypothetical protein